MNTRTYFDSVGCHIHGHPNCGGILIKRAAKIVDLQYLSLPHLSSSERFQNATEEDEFCERMRRVGASWWKNEAEFLRAYHGEDDYYDGGIHHPNDDEPDPDIETANEVRARSSVTFGWPMDGTGVWVSRFTSSRRLAYMPRGFRKIDFAINMEERIQVMQEAGVEFVEDLSLVKELHQPWSSDVYDYYTSEESADDMSSSSVAESVSSSSW